MYSKEEKVLIWLSSFEFVTYKKIMSIIDNFDLVDLFDNLLEYKKDLMNIFTANEYIDLLNNNNFLEVDRVIDNYERSNIKMVTIKSVDYPQLLKEIDTPPVILYCKGNMELLNSECLGVVGSRRSTKYSSTIGSDIIKDIASENITIVSGLADGADTIAHRGCLEVGGKTIAVLGGGILNIYPSSNKKLAEDIIEKDGLLISEYKPGEQALTFHFPVRNRIIAGISKGVFILEATEKSGSMHTKNYAIEYNREVFALPARVGDIYSVGCNKIIQNGQAKMVLSSKDIIDFYGKHIERSKKDNVVELSFDEKIIYDILLDGESHFEEIAKKSNLDTKILLTMLMRMEIKGIISKMPGNMYMITKF